MKKRAVTLNYKSGRVGAGVVDKEQDGVMGFIYGVAYGLQYNPTD